MHSQGGSIQSNGPAAPLQRMTHHGLNPNGLTLRLPSVTVRSPRLSVDTAPAKSQTNLFVPTLPYDEIQTNNGVYLYPIKNNDNCGFENDHIHADTQLSKISHQLPTLQIPSHVNIHILMDYLIKLQKSIYLTNHSYHSFKHTSTPIPSLFSYDNTLYTSTDELSALKVITTLHDEQHDNILESTRNADITAQYRNLTPHILNIHNKACDHFFLNATVLHRATLGICDEVVLLYSTELRPSTADISRKGYPRNLNKAGLLRSVLLEKTSPSASFQVQYSREKLSQRWLQEEYTLIQVWKQMIAQNHLLRANIPELSYQATDNIKHDAPLDLAYMGVQYTATELDTLFDPLIPRLPIINLKSFNAKHEKYVLIKTIISFWPYISIALQLAANEGNVYQFCSICRLLILVTRTCKIDALRTIALLAFHLCMTSLYKMQKKQVPTEVDERSSSVPIRASNINHSSINHSTNNNNTRYVHASSNLKERTREIVKVCVHNYCNEKDSEDAHCNWSNEKEDAQKGPTASSGTLKPTVVSPLEKFKLDQVAADEQNLRKYFIDTLSNNEDDAHSFYDKDLCGILTKWVTILDFEFIRLNEMMTMTCRDAQLRPNVQDLNEALLRDISYESSTSLMKVHSIDTLYTFLTSVSLWRGSVLHVHYDVGQFLYTPLFTKLLKTFAKTFKYTLEQLLKHNHSQVAHSLVQGYGIGRDMKGTLIVTFHQTFPNNVVSRLHIPLQLIQSLQSATLKQHPSEPILKHHILQHVAMNGCSQHNHAILCSPACHDVTYSNSAGNLATFIRLRSAAISQLYPYFNYNTLYPYFQNYEYTNTELQHFITTETLNSRLAFFQHDHHTLRVPLLDEPVILSKNNALFSCICYKDCHILTSFDNLHSSLSKPLDTPLLFDNISKSNIYPRDSYEAKQIDYMISSTRYFTSSMYASIYKVGLPLSRIPYCLNGPSQLCLSLSANHLCNTHVQVTLHLPYISILHRKYNSFNRLQILPSHGILSDRTTGMELTALNASNSNSEDLDITQSVFMNYNELQTNPSTITVDSDLAHVSSCLLCCSKQISLVQTLKNILDTPDIYPKQHHLIILSKLYTVPTFVKPDTTSIFMNMPELESLCFIIMQFSRKELLVFLKRVQSKDNLSLNNSLLPLQQRLKSILDIITNNNNTKEDAANIPCLKNEILHIIHDIENNDSMNTAINTNTHITTELLLKFYNYISKIVIHHSKPHGLFDNVLLKLLRVHVNNTASNNSYLSSNIRSDYSPNAIYLSKTNNNHLPSDYNQGSHHSYTNITHNNNTHSTPNGIIKTMPMTPLPLPLTTVFELIQMNSTNAPTDPNADMVIKTLNTAAVEIYANTVLMPDNRKSGRIILKRQSHNSATSSFEQEELQLEYNKLLKALTQTSC